jgi:hypothetical protein
LDTELARLQAEGRDHHNAPYRRGVGRAAFQVRDPNGIVVQLVDWNATTAD